MVAAQNEAVASPTADGLHAAPISLDASGLGIVKPAAMHGPPEIGVKLEVRAAPLLAHGVESLFEMFLYFRVSSVERIPRSVAPSSESDLAGDEGLIVVSADEPVGMFVEDVGALFRYKGRHPNGRFQSATADLFEDCDDVAAKS